MSEIKKGDVVTLKSGGPAMTVQEVGDFSGDFGSGPENGASCVWFEKERASEKVFDVAVLKIVEIE